jgi:hypothetical protein
VKASVSEAAAKTINLDEVGTLTVGITVLSFADVATGRQEERRNIFRRRRGIRFFIITDSRGVVRRTAICRWLRLPARPGKEGSPTMLQ